MGLTVEGSSSRSISAVVCWFVLIWILYCLRHREKKGRFRREMIVSVVVWILEDLELQIAEPQLFGRAWRQDRLPDDRVDHAMECMEPSVVSFPYLIGWGGRGGWWPAFVIGGGRATVMRETSDLTDLRFGNGPSSSRAKNLRLLQSGSPTYL